MTDSLEAYNTTNFEPLLTSSLDRSDAHVIRILRNHVRAMRSGSKLIIYDAVLPEPNTLPLLEERDIRSMDMIMMSLFNARERDQDDWLELLKQAHPGYGNVLFHIPTESPWCVIEVTWDGSDSATDM